MKIKQEIKISIVVITYNHELYIRQALNSILQQEHSYRYEILVGDDASSDNTPLILNEYQKNYPELFHVFLRKKNIGASRNLYELLCNAKGIYIALLEGDDYWINNHKLRKQIDFLDENLSFSACTHDCLVLDIFGKKMKNQHLIWLCKKKKFTLKDCKGFYLSGQTGTLVFRNFLKQSEKNYSIIYSAHPMISDRTIQTILTAIAPIFHMNESMSVYRCNISENGTNATAVLFIKNRKSPLENLELTFVLEQYIYEQFGKRLPCRQVKHMFFAIAVLKWLVHPSKETALILKSMFKHKNVHKAEYLLALPIEIVRRVYDRLRRTK